MLLLYALARPVPNVTTLVAPNVSASSLNPFAPSCDNINKCRTIIDILWNCYSVVLLCTWVTIHPNVPKVGRHTAAVLLEYGLITFIALVTPELMVLWALRQWLSSRRVARKYRKYGWTQSHAFLVIMGGLVLYEGDSFIGYLWDTDHFNDYLNPSMEVYGSEDGLDLRYALLLEKGTDSSINRQQYGPLSCGDMAIAERIYRNYSCLLEYLVAKGFVKITEDEIRDRGHADALSKTITVLQASWFMLQCLARAVQGLAVTELEVITFAFAILSFVTNFFWWHKPLRVRRPVRVILHPCQPALSPDPPTLTWRQTVIHPISRLCRVIRGIFSAVSDYVVSDYKTLSKETPFAFLRCRIFGFLYPFASLSARYRDIVMGLESDDCRYLFSSRLERARPLHRIALYPVSIIFGAIHCIPWFFTFPTRLEQTLWRIAALFVIGSSVSTGLLHALHRCLWRQVKAARTASQSLLVMLFAVATAWYLLVFLQCILYALYVAARLVVIAISFTTLRDLPSMLPAGGIVFAMMLRNSNAVYLWISEFQYFLQSHLHNGPKADTSLPASITFTIGVNDAFDSTTISHSEILPTRSHRILKSP
uniref:Uncharacterized protein n=1 Tax=Moniliophthora roreri TaxID=221103 RepID=A0A0W0EW16_MONRR